MNTFRISLGLCTAVLCGLLTIVQKVPGQSLEELRSQAKQAQIRRTQLTEGFRPKKRLQERGGRSQDSKTPKAQLAWTPTIGSVIFGTSHQEYDGGLDPSNIGLSFDRQLRILWVSKDKSRFTGVIEITNYFGNGKRGYWGASAKFTGQIKNDRFQIKISRRLDVPRGTHLAEFVERGRIQEGEVTGRWNSPGGAMGTFKYSLPRKKSAARPVP